MDDLPAPKSWSYDVVLTEHVFDKLWDLDLTLAEFRVVLADVTEVIEVTELGPGEAKEVLLNLNWIRPLHVVVVCRRRQVGGASDHRVRAQPEPLVRRLPKEALMRCATCDQAERLPVRRAKMVERDGRVAVIHGVPMEECPSCGTKWLTMDVAETLDSLLRQLLDSGAETATGHWDELRHTTTAA
ncbi:MAG TPA: YgiT-type zinc finger protein [Acidimicrobiales bacterium]|nr:YgiT-type zinc finger protein [Acidimicrobiales bacterium]